MVTKQKEPRERIDNRKQLGSRVDPELLYILRIEAAKRRTSVTVLVNEALTQMFGKPKPSRRKESTPVSAAAN